MKTIITLFVTAFTLLIAGCEQPQPQVAASGARQTEATVTTQPNGLTVEQQNIKERLQRDNKPGSIKYLYVISAYSGDVLIYSTVKGKVTSSGKRLTPRTVMSGGNNYGIPVRIGNDNLYTGEVIEDDGTFGNSVEYLYWFDSNNVYHQHYVGGGQIVHISDQPLVIKHAIINMEQTTRPSEKVGSAAQ